jgi:hypothetical protein
MENSMMFPVEFTGTEFETSRAPDSSLRISKSMVLNGLPASDPAVS